MQGMTRLIFTRHGQTDVAGQQLSGHRAGIQLNDEGEKQVKQLADCMARMKVDEIFSSPLERTLSTAEAIARKSGKQVRILQALIEMDFGEWTGRTVESLKDDENFHRFNTFRSIARVPGGETMSAVQRRVIAAIEEILLLNGGKTLVFVSHADVIRAALVYYAGMSLDVMLRMEISTASYSIVDIYPGWISVQCINRLVETG